jgi:hypothetical protein
MLCIYVLISQFGLSFPILKLVQQGAGHKQRAYSASARFAVICFCSKSSYGPVGKTPLISGRHRFDPRRKKRKNTRKNPGRSSKLGCLRFNPWQSGCDSTWCIMKNWILENLSIFSQRKIPDVLRSGETFWENGVTRWSSQLIAKLLKIRSQQKIAAAFTCRSEQTPLRERAKQHRANWREEIRLFKNCIYSK